MRGIRLFMQEIKSILADRKLLISVIAVILIPVLYSSMFLWAFWDPYARMDRLPVAVVNLDKGATFQGERLEIGNDLIQKLKENPKFNWNFVDPAEGEKGLKENKYYMLVEIPEDFSERATTVLTDHPMAAEIRYIPNESFNFLAAQIGESAMEKIKAEIASNVTEKYTETMFEKLTALADGLEQASGGAGELADGSQKAESGSETLYQNLASLSQGSLSLQEGISKVEQGGVSLQSGAKKLNDGIDRLSTGIQQLAEGHGKLQEGSKEIESGIVRLNGGMEEFTTRLAETEAGAQQLAQALEQYGKASGLLSKDPNFYALVENTKRLAGGLTQLKQGEEQLSLASQQLLQGEKAIIQGMGAFQGKLEESKKGVDQLHQGAASLLQGTVGLNAGLQQLAKGAEGLTDGAQKLTLGSKDLAQGLITLREGMMTLKNKLSEANGEMGGIYTDKENTTMFSDPIRLNITKYTEVPNYGTGFSPYFLSLGLYVGALILTIILSLRIPPVRPKSAFSWFIGKFLTFSLIGVIQALIADMVILYGLGVHVKSVPLFYLFSIITSLAFVAMIQFWVTLLNNPGRFIAILILILQLTSSAGTFPLEVIPNALQAINPWLPMTYSVAGFKAVISSGNYDFMWHNAGVLFLFIGLSALGTYLTFLALYKRHFSDQKEEVALASL